MSQSPTFGTGPATGPAAGAGTAPGRLLAFLAVSVLIGCYAVVDGVWLSGPVDWVSVALGAVALVGASVLAFAVLRAPRA
ncbi:hypothetical protein ACFWMQ_08350 [Streptomyces sp. NPDC058372]|uniref:hypothetical protein n=1 Tax=Streptomyces sp. NPDC058372 TaxID=3346464 RepID=UPI00365AC8A3